MIDGKQVQVKSKPLRNEREKRRRNKSAHKAFPKLGLAGRAYLSSGMRHFLESSVGKKSIHVIPRTSLIQW